MPIAIVLPLPASVAERVALPAHFKGALPPSDLHLTLAVLTSAPADLSARVAELAGRTAASLRKGACGMKRLRL